MKMKKIKERKRKKEKKKKKKKEKKEREKREIERKRKKRKEKEKEKKKKKVKLLANLRTRRRTICQMISARSVSKKFIKIEHPNLTDEDVLKIKNFGRKSLREVKEILSAFGLHLGMNVKELDLKKAIKEQEGKNKP